MIRVMRHQTNLFSHVGNTMAEFVMQSLGCEVAALNTVHFSAFSWSHAIGVDSLESPDEISHVQS
jgi:pyridoxal/pyridoxine/pyridoxamine kinase